MFSLKLENANSNIINIHDGVRYKVLSVSGLNPPAASIFTSKSPNRKGAKYNGSTLNERVLVITIKVLGDIEANRNHLYSWVETEQYCKIYYKNGMKNVYCEGYVQECPIDLFTDNEVFDISILCPNPYWKEFSEIANEISNLLKQFTFPFSIDAGGVPFSTIRESNNTTILNTGTETGVRITVKCKGDVEQLAIYDAADTSRIFRVKTTMKAGWILVIDTDASPKTVKLYKPDGTTENYLKNVGVNPTWFILKKGLNTFGFSAANGTTTNAEITIGYVNKYTGV